MLDVGDIFLHLTGELLWPVSASFSTTLTGTVSDECNCQLTRLLTNCNIKKALIADAGYEGPDQTAHAQSDQGLRCPLTKSSSTV